MAGRYRRRLAQEQHAAAVYRALAAKRTGEDREILLALARAEERHAAHWSAKLRPEELAAGPGWRTRLFGWLARRLGSLVVLGLVQRAEAAGDYDAGMAGAGTSSEIILLTGLAGLLAGALSMAAGEYVSVRSQRELLDATAHRLDPATLATLRDHEAHELALVFRARGLSPEEAERRAEALLGQPGDPPAAPELDPAEEVVGSAGAAAWSSFVAFASGAVVPVLPFFVTSGRPAIVAAAVLVGLALFATGATVGVLTGGPLVRRGLRQLAIGAGAAVVTYALGRVFGATLG